MGGIWQNTASTLRNKLMNSWLHSAGAESQQVLTVEYTASCWTRDLVSARIAPDSARTNLAGARYRCKASRSSLDFEEERNRMAREIHDTLSGVYRHSGSGAAKQVLTDDLASSTPRPDQKKRTGLIEASIGGCAPSSAFGGGQFTECSTSSRRSIRAAAMAPPIL